MPARITPDSNILISALIFGGNPLRLLEMALGGEVSLFISDAILQETLRVLRQKFDLSEERLARAESYMVACTTRVKPSGRVDAIKEDPDDNRVLECAEAAGCEYIITGRSRSAAAEQVRRDSDCDRSLFLRSAREIGPAQSESSSASTI